MPTYVSVLNNIGIGSNLGIPTWNPLKPLEGESVDFWVKPNSRSGYSLVDSVNAGAGNATILPSVTSPGSTDSLTVPLGTSYNPTASVFTIYARVRYGGLVYYHDILASTNSTFAGIVCCVTNTGYLGSYVGSFRNSTLQLTTGVWQDVIWRFTTGASGKIEVALDGSAFQTVYSGSIQTTLINGNGQLILCNDKGLHSAWSGAVSEIKLFTSSKNWTNYTDPAEKHWLFTGNTFVPDIASSPLNGIWSAATIVKSYGNGSLQSLNYGFSLWTKSGAADIYIPHKSDGTPFAITAGVEIPAGYELSKEVAGDLLNHNLADSLIQKIWTGDKYSNIAQVSAAPRYSDAFNENSYHVNELSQLYDLSKPLKELFSFTTIKTGASLAKILTYIGAKDYYKFVKYSGNPLIAGYYGSIVYNAPNDYTFYYSDNTNILRASSTDGVTLTPDVVHNPVMLAATLVNAWREGNNHYMLYRPGINLATSSDEGATWTKYTSNPVMVGGALGVWDNGNLDPWGIIKVGSVYYMWYNTINLVSRESGLATSTDLIHWTKDSNNPIFTGNRFCLGIFKYNGKYYLLVPRTDSNTFVATKRTQKIELYEDSSPTFYPASRKYLGVVMYANDLDLGDNWEWDYVDTPSVLTTNINRDTFPNGKLEMYYCSLDAVGAPWKHGVAYACLEFLSKLTAKTEPV